MMLWTSYLPLLLAAVLIVSGVAKVRNGVELREWEAIGVPAPLRKRALVIAHPWAEIALGSALALTGGLLGVVIAALAVLLLLAYTMLIWRAWRSGEGECACFSTLRPVTGWHVARNLWLLALAAGILGGSMGRPAFGGAVSLLPEVWPFVAAGVLAAATLALVLGGESAGPAGAASIEDDGEYVRTPTPAVPVTFADGSVTNLRALTAAKPLLVLALSPTCAACAVVIEHVARYRELLPEVDVRLLLGQEPDESALTEFTEPQSLHDPHKFVRDSIGYWPVPTAVLFGTDGLLAGGPVSGAEEISAFISDVYFELHGELPIHR